MRIDLVPFSITKPELRRLYWMQYLRRAGLLYLIMVVVGIAAAIRSPNSLGYALALLCILYLPILCLVATEWMLHRAKIIDRTTTGFLEDNFLNVQLDSGTDSKINLSDFERARAVPGYLLLYVNRVSYVIIPDRAFESNKEKLAFWRQVRTKVPGHDPKPA